MKWFCYLGEVLYEPAVVRAEAHECSYLGDIFGCWPFLYCFYLGWVGADSILGDDVAKELDSGLEQVALARLELKAGSSQAVQHHY